MLSTLTSLSYVVFNALALAGRVVEVESTPLYVLTANPLDEVVILSLAPFMDNVLF